MDQGHRYPNKKFMNPKLLSYNTSIHFPQLKEATEWQEPEVVMSEGSWYWKVCNSVDNTPVLPEPIILPYKYNPRCKKLKNYGIFSLESSSRIKLVLDPEFYKLMIQHLELGPHKIFETFIFFKNEKIKVYNLYFMNNIIDYIDFEESEFKFIKDKDKSSKLVIGSRSEVMDIRAKFKSGIFSYDQFVLDKLYFSKQFDIFNIIPFLSSIYLSNRAIEFFSANNVLTVEIINWNSPSEILFKDE